VIVPTRGDRARLARLLDALARQTLARDRWELLLAADRTRPDPQLAPLVAALGARVVEARGGPGAARNAGAAAAHGAWLAFTEDDCTPAPDWLERAAAALDRDPAAEVLTGATTKPGGRPVHRQRPGAPLWLPTNLFVRRDAFARAGGYCEDYFDPATDVYFREDSDFGFALAASGARVVAAPDARVEHPDEHPRFWDPVRWARRHEMDPLLAARHPDAFRDHIEVHALGALRVRRPIVRACFAFVVALVAAAVATLAGSLVVGGGLALVAAGALLTVWAKWRFDPRRLPVLPIVPFVLVAALLRGRRRAQRLLRATPR